MRLKMRSRLWLAVILLVVAVLLAGGCAVQPARSPEEEVEPVITEGSRWFPESDKNFRQLTESEKGKVIEIALNTPQALKWLKKESQYETRLGWMAIRWENSKYAEWWALDYEVVESGVPAFVSPLAVFYPEVLIHFGEPKQWVVQVAVDLETGEVALVEEYPFRTGPTPPKE